MSFYSVILAFVAFGVIGASNPVHSALFLILLFCLSSCLLFSLTVDFMGLLLIIIYVGAIAVLFLFVIMMLSVKVSQVTESFVRYLPISFIVVVVFANEFSLSARAFLSLSPSYNSFIGVIFGGDNMSSVGYLMYDIFYFDVTLSGLVLLLSMVSAICLTHNESTRSVRKQQAYKQHSRTLSTVSVQE